MKRSYTFYFALIMMLMVSVSIETGWAQPVEQTFNFTGGQQSFVVPDGVTNIHVQAWGAEGATVVPEAPAGLGGFAEGDLAVTPGQTLEIFVGGQGCVQTFGTGCGGFNGGGNAFENSDEGRGGGGGASDVRVGGISLNERVIVAAGGGGGCEEGEFTGGNGGGLEGGPGGVSQPGGGGTQTAGGDGFFPPNCGPGGFGFGASADGNTCAGGGGGWYGGGSGCGGGGGSSFIDGVANGNTTAGVREGDGMVVLTFATVAGIPTLSEWGLIAMAGILGIAGFMVIRRRKVTA